MKKYLGIIVVFCCILSAGCVDKKKVREEQIKKYATDYYESNMKNLVLGANAHIISLDSLYMAVADSRANYDLKEFDKCSKESSNVTFKVDKDNNITETEINLDCK